MYFIRPNWLIRRLYSSAIWRIAPHPFPPRRIPPWRDERSSSFSPFGGDRRGGDIFLTFDDGPTPEITPWVLSTLKQFNAKATFFCIGANIEKHPEVFRQIISEGHAVGNHTYSHLNGWKVPTKEYLDNVSKCESSIKGYQLSVISNQSNSHRTPVTDYRLPLFRPPYGKIKRSQISLLTSHFSLIMWDVLSGDFDEKLSEEKCLKNVLTYTREGSIVVFHDSVKAKEKLFYVLPKALEHFGEKGFEFQRLSP